MSLLSNLCVLDFETTGLRPEEDFVTEIGALRVRDGIVVGRLQIVVNFGGVIPADITKLTGITQADIDAGCDPVKAFRILRAFIGDALIVAHNAAFDVAFLNRSYNRYGSEGLAVGNDWLCTKRLAQEVFKTEPGSFNALRFSSLAGLCKFFAISNNEHHRALNDAEVCLRVLQNLVAKARAEHHEADAQMEMFRNHLAKGRPHTAYSKWVPFGIADHA